MEHYYIKLDKTGKIIECKQNLFWNPTEINNLWKREYYEGDFEGKDISEVLHKATHKFKSTSTSTTVTV